MSLKANEWQSLGGGVAPGSALAAVARGRRVDCFVRGTDGALWVRGWDGANWIEWRNLGGVMTADPIAISGADDRIDCFVRGTDDGLWQRPFRGDRWEEWVKLEGKLGGAPAAVPHEGVRIDCLIRGVEGQLWCRSFDGAQWHAWYSLEGGLASDPVVVSSHPTHVDVFVKGTDGALWQRSWAGRWYEWTSHGAAIAEAPAIVCRGGGTIDIFARGEGDNHLWWRQADGTRWREWVDLVGGLASRPAAVALGRDRLVVLVRGTDNALWFRNWDGAAWTEWQSLGGQITAPPTAVVTADGEIVVFAAGTDGGLWTIKLREVADEVKAPTGRPTPQPRLATVVDTGALLGAAVERLNRGSILALLQQIAGEVDEHCRAFPGMIDAAIVKLRRELAVQIEALRVDVDASQTTIQAVNAALIALKAEYGDIFARCEIKIGDVVNTHLALRLPDLIQQITASLDVTIDQKISTVIEDVDVSALIARLEAMSAKIEVLKRAAEELDAGELAQVELLLKKLLVDLDLSSVLLDMKVNVGGTSLRLGDLLAILAGGDKVAEIHFTYNAGDLAGARFVLVDRSEVTFIGDRSERGDEVVYVFRAASWKGVPASFSLRLRKQTTQVTLCKRQIAVESYDVVTQTNVVFDLGAAATSPAAKEPRGTIPVCEVPPTIEPVMMSGPEHTLLKEE